MPDPYPSDPNRTQMLQDPNKTMLGGPPIDPNKTIMGVGPGVDLNLTQTIKPIQCPVCKSYNPAGMIYCAECGLIFEKALSGDAFGAPAVQVPMLVDENGRENPIRPGENTIGREADIQVADGRVSRRHAKVWTQDGQVYAADLGSTNGTKVNDKALSPNQSVPVNSGDKISLGGFVLVLQMPGTAGGGVTQQFAGGKTAAMMAAPREANAPARLVGDTGSYPLKAGISTFGRRDDNDVVIAEPYVSGHHGTIEVTAEGFFLTDLGSTNGTVLNSAKLVPNMRTVVNSDDVIQLGSISFKIQPEENQ